MIQLVPRYRNRVRLIIYQSCSWRQPAWSVLFLCILSINSFGQVSRAGPAEKAQDTAAKNTSEVEYQRLDVRPYYCSLGKHHVIDDKKTLQELIRNCQSRDIKLPKINFSKHTLIAMYAPTDLCVRLKLKIIRDDAEKRYHHIITANKPLRCRGIGSVGFWVLIPKMPRGYEVIFERQIEPVELPNAEASKLAGPSFKWECLSGREERFTPA
jgi:hypothetical protein